MNREDGVNQVRFSVKKIQVMNYPIHLFPLFIMKCSSMHLNLIIVNSWLCLPYVYGYIFFLDF